MNIRLTTPREDGQTQRVIYADKSIRSEIESRQANGRVNILIDDFKLSQGRVSPRK